MSLYINTTGRSYVAVAICDRCRMKKPYDELAEDRDSPGLYVCPPCADELDPYKLPARETESIELRRPRPDTELLLPTEAELAELSWPVDLTR